MAACDNAIADAKGLVTQHFKMPGWKDKVTFTSIAQCDNEFTSVYSKASKLGVSKAMIDIDAFRLVWAALRKLIEQFNIADKAKRIAGAKREEFCNAYDAAAKHLILYDNLPLVMVDMYRTHKLPKAVAERNLKEACELLDVQTVISQTDNTNGVQLHHRLVNLAFQTHLDLGPADKAIPSSSDIADHIKSLVNAMDNCSLSPDVKVGLVDLCYLLDLKCPAGDKTMDSLLERYTKKSKHQQEVVYAAVLLSGSTIKALVSRAADFNKKAKLSADALEALEQRNADIKTYLEKETEDLKKEPSLFAEEMLPKLIKLFADVNALKSAPGKQSEAVSAEFNKSLTELVTAAHRMDKQLRVFFNELFHPIATIVATPASKETVVGTAELLAYVGRCAKLAKTMKGSADWRKLRQMGARMPLDFGDFSVWASVSADFIASIVDVNVLAHDRVACATEAVYRVKFAAIAPDVKWLLRVLLPFSNAYKTLLDLCDKTPQKDKVLLMMSTAMPQVLKMTRDSIASGLAVLQQGVEDDYQNRLADRSQAFHAIYASKPGFDATAEFLPGSTYLDGLDHSILQAAARCEQNENPATLLIALYVINRATADVARVQVCRELSRARVSIISTYINWKKMSVANVDPLDKKTFPDVVRGVAENYLKPIVEKMRLAKAAADKVPDSLDAVLVSKMLEFCRDGLLVPITAQLLTWCQCLFSGASRYIAPNWEAMIAARDSCEIIKKMLVDTFVSDYKPMTDVMTETAGFLVQLARDCKTIADFIVPSEIQTQIAGVYTKSVSMATYCSCVLGCMYILRKWPVASRHQKTGQYSAFMAKNAKDGVSIPAALDTWLKEKAQA
eukprot:TRINITY_DN25914_c0_g1_i1.p1 TRINITY_DN25914_c0_g1~~TRINITY_DN25914_c0_g1_i1.p1  ORF type:complete len:873 (+),score=222.81 TRINITY_DN25914_c0_g1_i1:84-2621(+)